MKFFLVCLGLGCWSGSVLYGQSSRQASVPAAAAYAQSLYTEATESSPHLYNGPEYYRYDRYSKEHPFFDYDDVEEGDVYYDGQLFRQALLIYDIYKDELIVEYEHGGEWIQLQKEKVDYFSILKHRFFHLHQSRPDLGKGYYELLYDKESKLIARRVKTRQEHIDNFSIKVTFPYKTQFYLLKDNRYYPVGSKRSVLNLWKEHKKQLQKYIRDNQLDFRNNRQDALLKLTEYYDHLLHS